MLTSEQIETNVDAYRHWLNGGKVQHYGKVKRDDTLGCGGANVILYRKKPEPKPSTLRPWTANEVPIGAVFRHIVSDLPVAWAWTNKDSVRLVDGAQIAFSHLYLEWQYTIDHGATWHTCGVME